MTKRDTYVLLAAVGVVLVGFAGFIAYYNHSIRVANKEGLEGACRELAAQHFSGRIVHIDTYGYDSFMHGRFFNVMILIDSTAKQYVNYQYDMKLNRDLLEFAKVGQIAFKKQGSETFLLQRDRGAWKSFRIANCAEIGKTHEP
jgi:hypothetical protein